MRELSIVALQRPISTEQYRHECIVASSDAVVPRVVKVRVPGRLRDHEVAPIWLYQD